MKPRILISYIFTIVLYPTILRSEDLKHYIKANTLYVTNPFDHRTYTIPDISTMVPVRIHLYGNVKDVDTMKYFDKAQDEEKNKEGKKFVVDKAQITKYILECQELYSEERFKEAWDLLDLASELDANDYRLKKMKGSLLIRMGDEETGLKYWRDSLTINANQPDLKAQLKAYGQE